MLGMFVGFAAGVAELAIVGRQRSRQWPRRSVAIGLIIGFCAMAFDGTNAFLFDLRMLGLPHLYTPDLRLRLATGSLAGVAMAFALVPALAQATEVSDHAEEEGHSGWRDLALALGATAGLALLVASGWALLPYPLALLGAAGVLLGLALINRTILAALQAFE